MEDSDLMKPFLEKATPFFEYILVGGAYCALGYVFFWTFNASLIGILGMIAICYGGMKLLIGVLIYGGWAVSAIVRELRLRRLKEELAAEAESRVNFGQGPTPVPAPAVEQPVNPEVQREARKPFFLRHWLIISEVVLLFSGLVIILLTKTS